LFLQFNKIELTASDEQVVQAIEALAAGRMTEEELTSFFEAHSKSIKRSAG
jgi:prophage maintenance system killer protein